MTFQKIYHKKRKPEPTNKERKRSTISFRCDPYNFPYLSKLKNTGQRSRFINQSIARNLSLIQNPKVFLTNLILNHFSHAKHILRQTGRARAKYV